MPRSSGVLLHISSLPNKYGFGCFSKEAYDFVDFLSESGFKYWQVLPLNPVNESGSPFQSYSVFAGNPCFIDLSEFLTEKELLFLNKKTENTCNTEQKINDFNNNFENFASCKKLNFTEIYNKRIELLKLVFARDYKKFNLEKFKKNNSYWLNDYATFMALKEEYNKPYWEFPNGLNNYNKNALEEFKQKHIKLIEFYEFIQFLFYKQWNKLKKYANSKNIKIFGDIAFYPASDSCDVWAKRKEFCFDNNNNPKGIAGVPPDYFSKDGQLWGNPVYDIEYMKKNKYRFWIKRIEHICDFFDIVRLDHFRGFESFWVVDDFKATNAKKGKWVKGLGFDFFKSLKNKKLPIFVAEDLGIITNNVETLIKKLGIFGMRVFQFAFDENPKNKYFPHNYIDNCVAYIGTHDNNTFIGFLEEDVQIKTKQEIIKYLGQNENADNIEVLEMLFSVMLNSRAQIVILTMQDILFLNSSYRMNIPSTSSGNWCFRLEEKINYKTLQEFLLKLNITANRA